MRIKEMAVLAMMSTILIIMKSVLAALPNIELVTLLVILFTLHFGVKVFYVIYGFVLVEISVYGLGIWSVNYLYVWSLLALFVLLFRHKGDMLFWAFAAGFFGLAFGALTAIPYLFIGGLPSALAYWVKGLLFDIIHFAGNFMSVILLFRPLDRIIRRLLSEIRI